MQRRRRRAFGGLRAFEGRFVSGEGVDYLRGVQLAAPTDPMSRRLQLVTGKGGVGKSTLVAALALEAARRGRRPLIVDPGESQALRRIFDVDAIESEPVAVAAGVRAVRLSPQQALRAYLREHLPLRSWAEPVARMRPLQRFFRAAPGAVEVLVLYELQGLLEHDAGWDPILVDMDATGHALMFLQLPSVFEGLLSHGPLQRLLQRVTTILSDPATTCMHLVALPRDLVVQETLELHRALLRTGRLPWGRLLVNAMPAAALPTDVVMRLGAWEEHARRARCEPLLEDVHLARMGEEERERASAQLARLRELSLPTVELPYLESAWRLEGLRTLGRLAWEGEAP